MCANRGLGEAAGARRRVEVFGAHAGVTAFGIISVNIRSSSPGH